MLNTDSATATTNADINRLLQTQGSESKCTGLLKCSWLTKTILVLLTLALIGFVVLFVIEISTDKTTQLNQAKEDLKKQKQESSKLNDTIKALEAEKKSLQDQLDTKNKEITQLKKDIAALTEEIATLKTKISTLEKEVEDKKAEIQTLKTELAKKEKEVGELNKKMEEIKKELEAKSAEVTKLQGQITWYQIGGGVAVAGNIVEVIFLIINGNKITQLEASVKTLETKVGDLNSLVLKLNKQIEDQKAEIAQKDKIIKEQTQTIGEQTKQIETLKSKIAEQAKTIEEKEKQLKEEKERYAALEKKYNDLTIEHSALLKKYAELEKTYNKVLEEYAKLQGEHDALKKKYEALETKYDELSRNYTGLDQKFKALEQQSIILNKTYSVTLDKLFNATINKLQLAGTERMLKKTVSMNELFSAAKFRDFSSDAFWTYARGMNDTLIMIITNDNYAFGSYFHVALNSSVGLHSDPDAFLFSMNNSAISKIAVPDHAYYVKPDDSSIINFGVQTIKIFSSGSKVNCSGIIDTHDNAYEIPPEYARETFYYPSERFTARDIVIYQLKIKDKQ